MEDHRHVFDSDLMFILIVLQGIQYFLLACECGSVRSYGGGVVRPDEAAFYGHTETGAANA